MVRGKITGAGDERLFLKWIGKQRYPAEFPTMLKEYPNILGTLFAELSNS
jgi:hypothetical protein